jgi:heavy metal sensor kinase
VPIRARLALAAAVIALLLVAVGGVVFVRSFRAGQVEVVDRGLRGQADTIARALRATPDVDLGAPGPEGVVATGELVVQLLDEDGGVVDTTREAGRQPVIDVDTFADASRTATFTDVALDAEREAFRVLARPFEHDGQSLVLTVGTSLEETDAAVDRVQRGLLVGGGIAVAVTGLGAWLLAGAALRPVDRMRREASLLSERDATPRLEVPSTRDELSALAATMNEMLDRLHGALERQRDFVADAGHELRTPLAVLKAELELARRGTRSATELREAIDHAHVEVDRLTRLADEMLFLARDDARQMHAHRTIVGVGALLQQSARAFEAAAAAVGVQVDVDAPCELHASLDEDLVRRAIDNLVENALRHSPSGSTILVSASRRDDALLVEVRDQGPGFPAAALANAFERFHRFDAARARSAGGAGLGLAIVAAVARAHGGTAEAANRGDGGAVVTFTIAGAGERASSGK